MTHECLPKRIFSKMILKIKSLKMLLGLEGWWKVEGKVKEKNVEEKIY